MIVYRRRLVDVRAPMRGLMALALLALVSTAFAADPAPLPKADPIQLTPIAPTAAPAAAPKARLPQRWHPQHPQRPQRALLHR